MIIDSDPWTEGYEAYHKDVVAINPYDIGDVCHELWNEGFNVAADEHDAPEEPWGLLDEGDYPFD